MKDLVRFLGIKDGLTASMASQGTLSDDMAQDGQQQQQQQLQPPTGPQRRSKSFELQAKMLERSMTLESSSESSHNNSSSKYNKKDNGKHHLGRKQWNNGRKKMFLKLNVLYSVFKCVFVCLLSSPKEIFSLVSQFSDKLYRSEHLLMTSHLSCCDEAE